jgi:hypothetical protein
MITETRNSNACKITSLENSRTIGNINLNIVDEDLGGRKAYTQRI